MAATSVFLSHSGLMKRPSPLIANSLPSHLKHQQHHLWGFPKGLRRRPSTISVSGLGGRQIRCIRAKATSDSEIYFDPKETTLDKWKKWGAEMVLSVQKWRESFEVEKLFSPLSIAKFAAWASLGIFAVKLSMNPYLWMYSTWYLAVWPWPTAVLLGIASMAVFYRRSKGEAKLWEQLLMVTGALTWLIIVPHAHLNGFIDGWPLNLFFVYFAYMLINVYLRKVAHGSVHAQKGEKQTEWVRKNSLHIIAQIAFAGFMLVGHWMGAYESPVLRGGRGNSFFGCLVIFIAMVLHYYGSYFFLKYSAAQVRPLGVVMFGPYRWIRHPVYASNMIFLLGCFIALRAYVSLGFVFVVSFLYYNQKSKLEEAMMVEKFGESYITYRNKVKKRFLPFIF